MVVSVDAAPVVLSVDRLHRGEGGDLVEAGELLLTELHCVNCHEAGEDLKRRIPVAPAPDLGGAGARLRPEFLRAWLANPHGSQPGSRMPDMFAALPEQARRTNAGAIAAFLEAIATPVPADVRAGDTDRGRELFHSVGCVACHAPRSDFTETAAGEKVAAEDVKTSSIPLAHVPAKYTGAGLADFLRHPKRARPSGRMPGMGLTEQEAADLTAYLGARPAASGSNDGPSERLVYIGRKLFSSVGCASCHELTWRDERIDSELTAPPLAALAGKTGGCLSEQPQHRKPIYRIDNFQRRALISALMNLKRVSPVAPIDLNHRRMVRLNCYACHERRGKGGPDAARLKYFVSSGADLGDEGRVPPTLSGVGRKLREDAMVEIIQGRFPARPYMTTRMPEFPEAAARAFAAGFAKAGHDPREQPTPRDGEENQVGRNMWGRALLGTTGLSCITCHELNGRKSLGIPAIDLALSAKRLRPEWFRDYLLDPAKFRPGTRMPAFWPNGKPILKGNGGQAARQIDSIWVYLNEVDQSRLPEGMEKKGNFLLTPKDGPMVFRTFMEGAGMHAIAVGYPAGVHVSFDSQNLRWANAWTGKFLDAESTWDDRFTPLATPAGEQVVAIQPLDVAYETGSFLGYTVRGGRAAEFRYVVNGATVEDTMIPEESGGRHLRRSIGRVGSGESIWFEIASGKRIEPNGKRAWSVDGRLKVSVTNPSIGGESRVVKSKDGQRLQVLLKTSNNRSMTYNLTIVYEW